MRESLTALKLVLDELGVPSQIQTWQQRLLIQKAVYIAQATGGGLGYSYGWYVRGPYSPELTRDYYALEEALETEPEPQDKRQLKKGLKPALQDARDMLAVPTGVSLSQPQWAELVASVIFLKRERKLGDDAIQGQIKHQKPALSEYTGRVLTSIGHL